MVEWNPRRALECWRAADRVAAVFASMGWDASNGFLYRFEDRRYASLDPYKYEWGNDDEYDIVTRIHLTAIPIRSITKCGWTIKANNGLGWRFISRDTVKQYACPTVIEALESYIARKNRQESLYLARANAAKKCREMAQGYPWNHGPLSHVA